MTTTQQGIIALLKSAVTEQPAPLPEGFCLEEADDVIRKQALIPLIFHGAHICGLKEPSEILKQYQREYIGHMLRSERQSREAEKLFRIFAENGIDHMPVKGCVMKKLYPRPELRVMGDADILIRPEQHDKIRPLLQEAGFSFLSENEHVFEWRSTGLYVELHKSLVPPSDEDYYGYYGTGWRLAVPLKDCRYDMFPENTFLFLFTHFARHYRFSGIGCRHVVDLYVYRMAFHVLDERYLRKELTKLNLLEFYENTMRLLDVWFGNAQGDEITELMTAFLFSGGSWGTETSLRYHEAVKNRQKKQGRSFATLRAALRAVFPPSTQIHYTYPVLRKHPRLLPVYWVIRWFDILFFRRYVIHRKLEGRRTEKDARLDSYEQALRRVGLDFGPVKDGSGK